ncbi:beta-glucosidase family protein [Streptomyces noursei]|uniref:beta-glucosidase family protein n=1 Tax=Streptomyces noursei TaxID=1971 RepID=UPI0016722DD6|nr:glycoside hydrolase family 3 C-terminal domain-containing protein [Streptomyces noursei]MCZ1015572.1 glycoside hydrolase family 3 C-terminal domain-containing protein [Streptomyces noursei]GGW89169.1 beta-glucosidase [Streptomyces noursei]
MTDQPHARPAEPGPRTAPGAKAGTAAASHDYTDAVERALGALDLDTKVRLLSGQDMWSLPAVPAIGLRSLVMSDGPIGVRGRHWSAADPSVALPSPTALAATWDPELARRAGLLLAQEARRKGVHVLLAPTVNLHRSPLGGRHFECYSEDPLLTGVIGAGYVRGVQEGGVGTTVKHFVGNDAETDRFTVDNRIAPRPLHELYLAPFEHIVTQARPWGIMTAYNQVNGSTMTEHHHLVTEVLRGAWGFDGCNVSDWTAARNTVRALRGGLDVAMPGPRTVFGAPLAAAVRAGEIAESEVDAAVRRVLLLAARTGCLDGVPPAAPADALRRIDGRAVARELARRAVVLLRNEPVGEAPADGARPVLPLDPAALRRVAVIGAAARDARVLGGGSATVFPARIVSPLAGLRAALPDDVEVVFATGADPRTRTPHARDGFTLRARYLAADGRLLAETPQFDGKVQVLDSFPDGVTRQELHAVELTGSFVPRITGPHTLALVGAGRLRLTLGESVLFDGDGAAPEGTDPFEAFLNPPEHRVTAELAADQELALTLRFVPHSLGLGGGLDALNFVLGHLEPQLGGDAEIAEAVRAATGADAAIVVVATTEEVESEGFDRTDLRLPGRQDELVARVAAANPRTVVVVNSGSPVELPWRDEVPAVLLSWFPGQEAGTALADVLLGDHEPGGRLPTTWPARLADAPVTTVTPTDGTLPYTEGVFIGYRAWQRGTTAPAYPFGHGLGYTRWEYESLDTTPDSVRVRLRNAGDRRGREVVQIYLAPAGDTSGAPERPAHWLAGFGTVEAGPGESAEIEIPLPARAFEVWSEPDGGWRRIPGPYTVEAAHSSADIRLTARITAG